MCAPRGEGTSPKERTPPSAVTCTTDTKPREAQYKRLRLRSNAIWSVPGAILAVAATFPVLWHVRDSIDGHYLPAPVAAAFRCLSRVIPTAVVANSESTLQTLRLGRRKLAATVYSGITASSGTPPAFSSLPDAWDVDIRQMVIHDGCDAQAFGPAQVFGFRTPHAAPAPLAPVVALVGRIADWKGQHIFIEAAALVRNRFPEARFQIIGAALFDEHAYTGEIQELVRTLGLEDCVEFLGFRDDVPDLVAGLDVLVHASITAEPFGQVIVEGMAAARPIVATNGGGAKEIVVNGETGLLVPMGDVDAMAEAIVFLLDNREVAREMGARGYQRACELFSIERTARNMEAIYDEMLS